jgi:hypothetical protein
MRASISSSASRALAKLRPAFAPALEQVGAVPFPHLGAEAVLVHGPHRQHDMGMGFGQAVVGPVPMHVEIGDHAPVDELSSHEVAGQLDRLRLRHLARQGELQLARELRVAAEFAGLDRVPEPFPVGQDIRRTLGQQHLGMHDAALGGEVVTALDPVVPEPRGRPVGGGRDRARARGPSDDLHVEMIDRHDAAICATGTATSERRISAPSLEKFSGGTGPSRAVPATPEPFGSGAGILIASTA